MTEAIISQMNRLPPRQAQLTAEMIRISLGITSMVRLEGHFDAVGIKSSVFTRCRSRSSTYTFTTVVTTTVTVTATETAAYSEIPGGGQSDRPTTITITETSTQSSPTSKPKDIDNSASRLSRDSWFVAIAAGVLAMI